MADFDAYLGLDEQPELETLALLNIGHMYIAQQWGIRQEQGEGVGFNQEAATENLLGVLTIRIDDASKPKTDYVGLVERKLVTSGAGGVIYGLGFGNIVYGSGQHIGEPVVDVISSDVRVNDHIVVRMKNRKMKLTVSKVNWRGQALEVELKNG